MVTNLNILVLSDNAAILERAKPIFEKRKHKFIFTDSDSINPRLDHRHIIDNYDLVFSLHCRKIFPPVLVNSVRCVNIHPGYSPFNRGMYPHIWSIINGMPCGVTIHAMDEKIDHGKYYYRVQVDVRNEDTSESLYDRIIDEEMYLIDATLDKIIEGTEPLAYTEDGNYNSLNDFKKLCEIDPEQSGTFRELYNILRALSHGAHKNAHIRDIYLKLVIN